MSVRISRRGFLGASMLTFCIPSGLFADENNEVVLRFAAMSDVHYNQSHTDQSAQHVRFAKAIDFMNDFSRKQPYRGFDALVVAGDLTDHGIVEEIGPFKKTMDDHLKADTRRVLCMGNHEYYGGNRKLWESTFQMEGNKHHVINGYHFITVSPEKGTCAEKDYLYAVDWLEKNLAEAQADNPNRTIFVVQHYHVHSTVAGSYNLPGNFPAGVRDLWKTLRKYPQVFDISGHSHVPTVDPRSIWQGEFTAIGTGSLSYFGLYPYDSRNDIHRSNIVAPNRAGTFLLFEVFRDNTIRIRLYDTLTDAFFDREYLVADPANVARYIYTNKRYANAMSPTWPHNAKARVLDTLSNSAKIEFPQGRDEQCLTGYRIELDRFVNNEWKNYAVDFAWSDYFLMKRSPTIEVAVTGLLSNSRFRASIYGVNTFKKSSSEPLSVEFQTLPDGPYIDRKSPRPVANFINVSFDGGKPANNPTDPRFRKNIRTLGLPQVVQDASLGYAALLNGKNECYQVPVSAKDYNELRTEITLAVRFRLDLSKKSQGMMSLFGNTESGGLGFEYHPYPKKIAFVCNFNHVYERIEAPFDGEGDALAFGVYDGSKMLLYLNGKLVANKDQTGRIRYTRTAKARAFCIGGDITHSANARFYTAGLVAQAAVYSWALTPEQIASFNTEPQPTK